MNIFRLTQGKSPEEAQKIIDEYLAIRNHELLKDNSANISYSKNADMNSLTFNIFKMVQ
jgi:hypothetical protein